MLYFDVTCDVTLHCGRIRNCITLVVKLDKIRKSRKFRDERLMTCGWYGIVRQSVVEQGRIVAPGIEFNVHCYQRRKDAIQLHCLAELVTAGDIINRLRAPHRPFPFFAGLCYGLEEARKWTGKGEVRGGNTIFCIGKHHRFLVTRDLVIAVELVENGILEVHVEQGLHCIYQKNEFAQGAAQFTGRITDGKIKFFHSFECYFDSMNRCSGADRCLRFCMNLGQSNSLLSMIIISLLFK